MNSSPQSDGSDIKIIVNSNNEVEVQLVRQALAEALNMMQTGNKG